MRAGRADVTTPKLAAAMFVETFWNCVWFSALNDSSRNCNRTVVCQREILEEREIQVVHSGAALGVSSQVTERSGRWLREGGGIEPPVHGPVAGTRIPHEIRPGWCRRCR